MDSPGLRGISDKTLEAHFALYEGYVKNTNLLREQIAEMRAGKENGADPKFAELVRRLGFEYNGMRLHELYFDNLTGKPSEILQGGRLWESLGETFGEVETGVRSSRPSGRCVESVGQFSIRIPRPASFPTIGSRSMRVGTSPASIRSWSWTSGSMRSYSTTRRPHRVKYIEAFFEHVNSDRCEGAFATPRRPSNDDQLKRKIRLATIRGPYAFCCRFGVV